jgi:hypothetical protein
MTNLIEKKELNTINMNISQIASILYRSEKITWSDAMKRAWAMKKGENKMSMTEELKNFFTEVNYEDTFDDDEDFQEEMEISQKRNMEETLLSVVIDVLKMRTWYSSTYKKDSTLILTEREGVVKWTGSFCFIDLNDIDWTIDDVKMVLEKFNYKRHKIYDYREGSAIFINNVKTFITPLEEKIIRML